MDRERAEVKISLACLACSIVCSGGGGIDKEAWPCARQLAGSALGKQAAESERGLAAGGSGDDDDDIVINCCLHSFSPFRARTVGEGEREGGREHYEK